MTEITDDIVTNTTEITSTMSSQNTTEITPTMSSQDTTEVTLANLTEHYSRTDANSKISKR